MRVAFWVDSPHIIDNRLMHKAVYYDEREREQIKIN